jgi:hypothetical protein
MILQAYQAGWRAIGPAEVAGGKDGNAGGRDAEQEQEQAGQPVEAQMHRQIRQADGQHEPCGRRSRCNESRRRDACERRAAQRAQRVQRAGRERDTGRSQQCRESHHGPCAEQQCAQCQR